MAYKDQQTLCKLINNEILEVGLIRQKAITLNCEEMQFINIPLVEIFRTGSTRTE